jgi:hypothetical protein
VLEAIANSMNVRASEPAMQAICARYMGRTLCRKAQLALLGNIRLAFSDLSINLG